MKKVFFKTLGCKVNQYETQGMREALLARGFHEVKDPVYADFCIMNSCTVTQHSDRKTLYYIRRFKKNNPHLKVVLTGCATENKVSDIVERSHADIVVQNADKEKIADILAGNTDHETHPSSVHGAPFFSISSFDGHVRAFVKIQDGCNMLCSYCKVRLVRGSSQSKKFEDVLTEVRQLVRNGYKEVVLTGIQIGAYGKDCYPRTSLVALLDVLAGIEGLQRIRLSSIEPFDLDETLIDCIVRNASICHHLHIPIQSGDSEILKAMRRPMQCDRFVALIDGIRDKMPDFTLSTDVIVGFPGETEEQFQHTVDFLKRIKPFKIHIFPFSAREGTEAYALLDRVQDSIIKKREHCLQSVAETLFSEVADSHIGSIQNVLIEGTVKNAQNRYVGMTGQYMKVVVNKEDMKINELAPVKIIKKNRDSLVGEGV